MCVCVCVVGGGKEGVYLSVVSGDMVSFCCYYRLFGLGSVLGLGEKREGGRGKS